MLLSPVEAWWLREAPAIQQHGALCAIRGMGLSDHVVELADAVVAHQDEKSNGDGSETREEPPLTLPC
jgi:hypothetical protein